MNSPAFEELVNKYGPATFKYILSLMRQEELAEDLFQEVLLSAYLSFPSIKEKSKYKSWLFMIAINKCRDFWRKEKKTQHFWREEVYSYSVLFETHSLPEETIMDKYSREQMVEKVRTLPDMYRDPILLYYYQDLSLLEIAEKRNLPMSTVKTRMRRAKERLRPKMHSLT